MSLTPHTPIAPKAPAGHPQPDGSGPSAATQSARGDRGWFRAFWRWHFYASFLVVPILLVLAGTGLIYLLRFQVEPLLHADVMTVSAPAGAAKVGYQRQLDAVRAAAPESTVVSMTEPQGADRSTVFTTTTAAGEPREVYVDPYTGRVLGSLNPDTTLSGAAVRLHADLMAGPLGDAVIELAACWAIIMAVTGYVLYVRGRRARKRATAPSARLRRRHASVGLFVGVGLLTLLVSGLPWTGIWGAQVQRLVTAGGSSLWSTDPGAQSKPASTLDESLPHSHTVPWAQGKSPVPRSPGEGVPVADLDTAVAVAGRERLAAPRTVALPEGEDGVYSVIGYAFVDPAKERTVHLNRFSGQVVSDYGYRDYPVLAKVVAQGIAVHEGRRFGAVSFWATALFCVAVIFMCLSGPVMWWRRRPRSGGTLGAPRGRMPLRATPVLLVGVLVLGLVLPLFGLSLLIVLLVDRWVLRRVPTLGRWFVSA